jgi:thiol-disulfide isomerase/thioredoxin
MPAAALEARALRRARAIVLGACACTAVVLAAAACRSEPAAAPADEAARFPAPGSQPPELHLPELIMEHPWVGPDSVLLADLRGTWVYLDVFGSWCLPCRERHPEMLRVAEELRADGAHVIGILLEDRPETAARWLREHGSTYRFLVVDGRTARSWGLTGAPMGFLISPEGTVVRACQGCARGQHAIEGLPEELRRLRRGRS